jgi:hypothetical protein
LLWQSKQARLANARVWGLSQGGSATTGGLFPLAGRGINWISNPTKSKPIMTPTIIFFIDYFLPVSS